MRKALPAGRKPPLVSVYTVCHNYGRYLARSIESVLAQSCKDWELLVYNDGSTDETADVMERFATHPRVRLFTNPQQGLIRTCNQAIAAARGQYVLRLDADDYLDENALRILLETLRRDREAAMAFPDYYTVNEEGVVLEHFRYGSQDGEVLDLPAHGACSLVRKSALNAIGGYDEDNRCQDGYDLWLKLTGRYKVRNVGLPLFYYRMHGRNLTTEDHRILEARRLIKRRRAHDVLERIGRPQVLAIIPTRRPKANPYADPLAPLAGVPLIDHTLRAVAGSELVTRRVVVSEDEATLAHVRTSGFETLRRPAQLGGVASRIEETVLWTLSELERRDGYRPDLVALLYVHVPLRRSAHIDEAVHTQLLFKTDSVISVTRNARFLYRHGDRGMVPLYRKRLLRLQKEVLYEENGAVELSRTASITRRSFLGRTIGHVLMSPQDSVQITTEFERWLAEKLLLDEGERERLAQSALQAARP